jgi:hypothetical protein
MTLAPAAGGGPNRLVQRRDDQDAYGDRTRPQDLYDGLVLKLTRERQPLRSGRPVQPSVGRPEQALPVLGSAERLDFLQYPIVRQALSAPSVSPMAVAGRWNGRS